MAELIRLQKYFTDCGILSRRAAEAEIAQGKVKVNGTVASIGDKIDPDTDVVEYKGKRVQRSAHAAPLYVMLNKPRGIVTTAKDEKGRATVLDLLKGVPTRVYPIGRLDMDSEGLLLLTNDGELTCRLTHPKHDIPKIYHVTLSPAPTKEQLLQLSAPMEIDGYELRPVGIRMLSQDTVEMTLYEGRNRQIRKMCEKVNLKVIQLRRVAIGDLTLGALPIGKWRALTEKEVAYLYGQPTETENNHQPKGKG